MHVHVDGGVGLQMGLEFLDLFFLLDVCTCMAHIHASEGFMEFSLKIYDYAYS